MIHFESDYVEGTHPSILQALSETNLVQTTGYGVDTYCLEASELIKKECRDESVAVHFLMGGTQTNLTLIAATLKPYQGVIAPHTSHIYEHETGAIEACGHRIISVESKQGKLDASQVEAVCLHHYQASDKEHTVQPGMVFISHPTETGTLYTKAELVALRHVCDKWGLPLYLDGARLGYGIMADSSDLHMSDINLLCDAFYIGGTKVGALFGEALVVRNLKLQQDFRYMIKQKGGLLAKGRLLGIQFKVLFENGLYYEIARHGINLANQISETLLAEGFEFLYPTSTNQIFVIITQQQYEVLTQEFIITKWEDLDDDKIAIRICTSWATTGSNVDKLLDTLKKMK